MPYEAMDGSRARSRDWTSEYSHRDCNDTWSKCGPNSRQRVERHIDIWMILVTASPGSVIEAATHIQASVWCIPDKQKVPGCDDRTEPRKDLDPEKQRRTGHSPRRLTPRISCPP